MPHRSWKGFVATALKREDESQGHLPVELGIPSIGFVLQCAHYFIVYEVIDALLKLLHVLHYTQGEIALFYCYHNVTSNA